MSEHRNTVGRPSLGQTRKVSITLPEQLWVRLEQEKSVIGCSLSELLRTVIQRNYQEVPQAFQMPIWSADDSRQTFKEAKAEVIKRITDALADI